MASETSSSLRGTGVAAGCERNPPDGPRLIYKKELRRRVGLSFPTIWKMMRQGRFPRARIVGGKSAWFESEINEFLLQLPLRQYKIGALPDQGSDEKSGK